MAQAIPSEEFAARRRIMVDSQLRTCDVTDQAVLAAFADVPRETFVPPAMASLAYLDRDIPALGGAGRLLLAPMTLAKLIQAAGVKPGEKALDVACGSGYSAAILAALGAHVTGLDTDAGALAAAKGLFGAEQAIDWIAGDLAEGAAGGQFGLILVNGAFESAPEKLLSQLTDGGRLIGVDASFRSPRAVIIERISGVLSKRALFDAAAPRLEAFRRLPSFAF
jgi:protein-L-isoaspartate(D-aspartate) O-methyltransferase